MSPRPAPPRWPFSSRSGHSGQVGLRCPVAVAGWLPEPTLGRPLLPWCGCPASSGVGALPLRGGCPASSGWMPCPSGVDHLPFLATPTDGYKLHLLGLEVCWGPQGTGPLHPTLTALHSWGLCACEFRGQHGPPPAAHRGLGWGGSIFTWEQGPRTGMDPPLRTPLPPGQSLPPTSTPPGVRACPPAPPPGCALPAPAPKPPQPCVSACPPSPTLGALLPPWRAWGCSVLGSSLGQRSGEAAPLCALGPHGSGRWSLRGRGGAGVRAPGLTGPRLGGGSDQQPSMVAGGAETSRLSPAPPRPCRL